MSQLSDTDLLRALAALVVRERIATARFLALFAEVDHRRLYVPAGYSSMHAFCVGELRLSDDAAWRRIQAARAARQYPVLLQALASGCLHLTAVCLLAPRLTAENTRELVEAGTHRKRSEIETMLARRFPVLGEPTNERAMVRALPARASSPAPARVNPLTLDNLFDNSEGPEPGTEAGPMAEAEAKAEVEAETSRPGQDAGSTESSRYSDSRLQLPIPADLPGPASAPPCERYLVKLTIDRIVYDKLRYAQSLLSHAVPRGDVAQVLDRALDTLIVHLEKSRFGACTRPSATIRTSSRVRHIPAHVRRAVWRRDQGQCTFVSAGGHRCGEQRLLQFDHVDPLARGGRSTVEGLRLRCRAHNQYEAERVFGSEFMARKRGEARAQEPSQENEKPEQK